MTNLDNSMRVLIVGSPKFNNIVYTKTVVDKLLSRVRAEGYSIQIISGGCRGDRSAEQYARDRGIELLTFPSDWKEYGEESGKLRCASLVKQATHFIAFWDGKSERLAYMLDVAKQERRITRVFRYISSPVLATV